jgi:3-hydroxyacyl-CoA dehydrogenase
VFDDLDVKTALFAKLDGIVRSDAILATNTSYLDPDLIAGATSRPERVCGLHFFSPAHVMRLVEVVRCARTAPDVLATGIAVARRLGKLPIVCRVCEGFVGNRIFSAYPREAEFLVEEGAWPHEIDAAMEDYGFAMGPFAVWDMSGLDIAWRMRRTGAADRDPRARYPEAADVLGERGRLGQKTSMGWYRYPDGSRRPQPDTEVQEIIETISASKGTTRRSFSAEEITRRALLAMANEASLLLAEGVAERTTDVDLMLVLGYGFPVRQGGIAFWATSQDRELLERELDELAEATGYGFRRGDLSLLGPEQSSRER